MLVVDASVVVPDCTTGRGFDYLRDRELVAPPLLWSEARSMLHEAAWRGAITRSVAAAAHERLQSAPIGRRDDPELGSRAWDIAEELGWGKTYDAEYVALASLLECRLVTLDGRLRRRADRLGFVVAPAEL